MATAVQLEVTIDSSGAVTGVKQLGDALNKLPAPSRNIPAGFNAIESAERKAHQAAQLFLNITGVEMPRALEQVIAKSKVLGPVLAGAFQVSVFAAAGMAVLAVGEKIIEASKEAEQHRQAWIAIDGTVQDTTVKILSELDQQKQKYIELTQGPIAAMEFGLKNMRSAAMSAFQDISSEMTKMSEQFASDGGFFSVAGRQNKAAAEDIKRTIADMDQAMHDAAMKDSHDLIAPFIAEQQVLQKAIEDTQAKLTAAKSGTTTNSRFSGTETVIDQKQIDALQQQLNSYQKINEQIGHQIDLQKQSNKTSGQEAVEARQRAYDQVISMQHQADQAQLGGIALIRKQESDAIDEVMRKEKDKGIRIAEIAAIHAQAAEKERQAELDIAKAASDANLFAEQRANSFLQGSSKIIADADYEKDVLLANLGDYLERNKHTAEEVSAAWDAYYKKIGAIDKATSQQLAMNQQQLTDKLAEMQSQAAIAALPDYERAQAQIVLDNQRTVDQLTRQRAADLQNAGLYDQQIAAADALMNAQIIDQHRQSSLQIASDLTSVFDDMTSGNIGKRILDNMKKLFAEIVAEWLLTTRTMGSVFGKVLGTLLGGPQSSLENASGGGIGSLIGLFSSSGAPVPAAAAAGGSAGAAAADVFGPNSIFSSASVGLGLGAFAGNPLTTQSLSAAGVASASTAASGGKGALGSLSGLASKSGVGGLAALLLPFIGGKFGGGIGAAGGVLSSLAIMAALNPSGIAGSILGHIGALFGSPSLALGAAAGLGGGLFGFGIGQQFGGLAGSLSGAGAGALTGFIAAGPIGAAVGAIIGALGGIFGGLFGGSKRKRAANNYFDQQLTPAINSIVNQYEDHQLDFATADADLEQLRQQAADQLKALKGEGKDVLRKRVNPAIDAAEKKISGDETERQRRAGLFFGPQQFHDGGFVDAGRYSTWMRRPGEITAMLKDGEFVMNPRATAQNRQQLEHMNAGGRGRPATVINLNVSAIDAKSFDEWASTGGAKMLVRALNRASQEGIN